MELQMVIVFHYTDEGRLPKMTEQELWELRCKFLEALKKRDRANVYFDGAFVDEKGQGICLWRAPSAQQVIEVVKEVVGVEPPDGAIAVKRVL